MEDKNKKSPTQELTTNIKKLKESVDTSITFKRSFLLGVVRGVGAAIGATVVAGLLVLLAQKFTSFGQDIPIWDKFINTEQVEALIED